VIDSIEPYSYWQTKLQIFLLRFSDPIFVKLAKNLKRVGADKIVQNADLLVQVKEDMIFDPFQGRKVVNWPHTHTCVAQIVLISFSMIDSGLEIDVKQMSLLFNAHLKCPFKSCHVFLGGKRQKFCFNYLLERWMTVGGRAGFIENNCHFKEQFMSLSPLLKVMLFFCLSFFLLKHPTNKFLLSDSKL